MHRVSKFTPEARIKNRGKPSLIAELPRLRIRDSLAAPSSQEPFQNGCLRTRGNTFKFGGLLPLFSQQGVHRLLRVGALCGQHKLAPKASLAAKRLAMILVRLKAQIVIPSGAAMFCSART